MTSDTPGAPGAAHAAAGAADRDADRDAAGSDHLQVRTRSRWLGWAAALVGLVVFVVVVAYVSTHPEGLPESDAVVTASTPAGESVYVGVFQADTDFDRTLSISGVKVFAEATVPVTITPHLCRGGSLGVTSEPELFCTELVGTEGSEMTAGDEIVLEVTGDQPGTVAIERIRVGYRDGLQWATQFAGSPAVVEILSR